MEPRRRPAHAPSRSRRRRLPQPRLRRRGRPAARLSLQRRARGAHLHETLMKAERFRPITRGAMLQALRRTIQAIFAIVFFVAGLALGDFTQPALWLAAGACMLSAAF